jgi:endonuclease/exonuclease/phosphatase family metal-dependent hydrolase
VKRLVCVLALGACVDITDHGGPWQDASAITGPLAPELGPAPPSRAAPGCTMRIATWNLHFAADPADLAARIAESDLASADVLLVQEIRAYPDEPGSRASRLASALGMTWVYAPARVIGDGTHGVAILSRYPLEAPRIRDLPYYDQIHDEQRIALEADVVLGGERLRVVDVHLDTRMAPADRIAQLAPAVDGVGERLIVGGDFNTLPWAWVDSAVPVTSTEAITGQQQAAVVDDFMLELDFARALTPDSPTFPVPVFSMRLDNLYARGPEIRAAAVAPVDGSDHRPVWFDIDRCQP